MRTKIFSFDGLTDSLKEKRINNYKSNWQKNLNSQNPWIRLKKYILLYIHLLHPEDSTISSFQ